MASLADYVLPREHCLDSAEFSATTRLEVRLDLSQSQSAALRLTLLTVQDAFVVSRRGVD
jgi:hypothetical protein